MARGFGASETARAKELRASAQRLSERAAALESDAKGLREIAASNEASAQQEDYREAKVIEKYGARAGEFKENAEAAINGVLGGLTNKPRWERDGTPFERSFRNNRARIEKELLQAPYEVRAAKMRDWEKKDERYKTTLLTGSEVDEADARAYDETMKSFQPDFESAAKAGGEAFKVLKEYFSTKKFKDFSLFGNPREGNPAGMKNVVRELKDAPEVVKQAGRAYLASKAVEFFVKKREALRLYDKTPFPKKGDWYGSRTKSMRDRAASNQSENYNTVLGYMRDLDGLDYNGNPKQ